MTAVYALGLVGLGLTAAGFVYAVARNLLTQADPFDVETEDQP